MGEGTFIVFLPLLFLVSVSLRVGGVTFGLSRYVLTKSQ